MPTSLHQSLKEWLETNIPTYLASLNEHMEDFETWEMPVVEDYVLVIAVKDFKDGLGGVFQISDAGVPPYRINGLLQAAMD